MALENKAHEKLQKLGEYCEDMPTTIDSFTDIESIAKYISKPGLYNQLFELIACRADALMRLSRVELTL